MNNGCSAQCFITRTIRIYTYAHTHTHTLRVPTPTNIVPPILIGFLIFLGFFPKFTLPRIRTSWKSKRREDRIFFFFFFWKLPFLEGKSFKFKYSPERFANERSLLLSLRGLWLYLYGLIFSILDSRQSG